MIPGKDLMDLSYKPGRWFKKAIGYVNQNGLSEDKLKNYLAKMNHATIPDAAYIGGYFLIPF